MPSYYNAAYYKYGKLKPNMKFQAYDINVIIMNYRIYETIEKSGISFPQLI